METDQRGNHDAIAKANLKRARINAITFGVISGLALITLVYAFVQQDKVKEQMKVSIQSARVADSLRIKLDECAMEARKQMKLAEAAEEARHQQALK